MTRLLDLDALKQQNPLPGIVAGFTKLRAAGSEWHGCCPFHNDSSPSFAIYAGGTKWICYAGCGGGDVIDFLCKAHGVGLREAVEMLAGGEMPAADPGFAERVTREDEAAKRERIGRAKEIWSRSAPIAGTPAAAYLNSRGIVTVLPETLRFARLPYGERGPEHPCLVAACTDASDQLVGIQRTYLAADGGGKLDVRAPKLSLGVIGGGAIRLAPPSAEMIVCEGIEDGLSLQQELGRAVWAAAGASNLAKMQFPEMVTSIAIGGDNDAPGRAAVQKAEKAFALRGLRVRSFFPARGKDFNAELMESAR